MIFLILKLQLNVTWYWKYLEVLKWVLSSIVLHQVIFTRSGSEFWWVFWGIVDQFALTLPPEFDDRSVQIWSEDAMTDGRRDYQICNFESGL